MRLDAALEVFSFELSVDGAEESTTSSVSLALLTASTSKSQAERSSFLPDFGLLSSSRAQTYLLLAVDSAMLANSASSLPFGLSELDSVFPSALLAVALFALAEESFEDCTELDIDEEVPRGVVDDPLLIPEDVFC